MSLLLVLAPLALGGGGAAALTAASAAVAAAGLVGSKIALGVAAEANLRHLAYLKELYAKSQNGRLPPIETIYSDYALLHKTLTEHGLQVSEISDNRISGQSGNIVINYTRQTSDDVFWATVSGIQNEDEFFADFGSCENEYRQNVQTNTYNALIENLQNSNMSIESETVLEDNTILLTINI
jgi:hypothetical protein